MNSFQDKKIAESEETRIEKLEWLNERMRDDFTANQFLRSRFRVSFKVSLSILYFQNEKKDLNEQRAKDDDLRARSSLSIKLLPDSPDDAKVAAMLKRYSTVKCGFFVFTDVFLQLSMKEKAKKEALYVQDVFLIATGHRHRQNPRIQLED